MSHDTWSNTFPLMVEYGIAEIKDNKYVYSGLFKESAENLRQNPPGRVAQIRMGTKVRKTILPVLIQHAKLYKTKRDIESMITAYVCVTHHMKLHNIGIPSEVLPIIVWGVWWLNTHNPNVDDIKGGEL